MPRKKPEHAMLDGDVIAYQTAFWAETENGEGIEKKLNSLIKKWTPKECSSFTVALSCRRADNYRKDIWYKYKANRDALYSPEFLPDVRKCIRDLYKTKEVARLEADDILGIYTSSNRSVSVTIDKDLKCIPGWHFNPDKDKKLRYVSKAEAKRFFYVQWMTGDSTDGIPGLWRIGPKKAEAFLDQWKESEWDEKIMELYLSDKHHVRNAKDMTRREAGIAMAQCVRILTTDTYNLKTNKTKLWLPKCG
jgi:DNA polymerase-1